MFVDTGAIVPTSRSPLTDLTAGPGASIGYGQSAPGPVGNPNGVSIEFFEKRIINGYQAADYPYWHYVMPRVANFIIGARDITNAALQTMLTGSAFLNPNWSQVPRATGPSLRRSSTRGPLAVRRSSPSPESRLSLRRSDA